MKYYIPNFSSRFSDISAETTDLKFTNKQHKTNNNNNNNSKNESKTSKGVTLQKRFLSVTTRV